jgi:hypothetical protein
MKELLEFRRYAERSSFLLEEIMRREMEVSDHPVGKLSQFRVEKIKSSIGRDYIRKYHYSMSCHNGPMTYGLFDAEDKLIGVCAFATPCSENVRASIFGPEYKDHVTELHRLHVMDGTPANTETWFASRAIKALKEDKPRIWAVISFADSTEGHLGTIYQALNFQYYGTSGRARFYRDEEGRLRHPRQSGVNITKQMAQDRGWESEMRDAKHRYVLFTPSDRREKKTIQKLATIQSQEYPGDPEVKAQAKKEREEKGWQ